MLGSQTTTLLEDSLFSETRLIVFWFVNPAKIHIEWQP